VGLSMAERKAVTKHMARRYQAASKAEKGKMLDELCALTGWTRRHPAGLLPGCSWVAPSLRGDQGPGSTGKMSWSPCGSGGRRSGARRESVWHRSWPRRFRPWNVTLARVKGNRESQGIPSRNALG
jgi:hypothetical protein